jgi:ComF family protein
VTPKRILAALLDLLFPPRCAACRRPGAWFCADCLAQVEPLQGPLCPVCGEPLGPDARCPRRGRHSAHLAGVRSAAWHAGPLRLAIHSFKYGRLQVLAEPLAVVLADGWARAPLPVDLLLPVPLHARRLRERGFNQSTLLARGLGQRYALPMDDRSLQRVRATKPQVELGAAERLSNVQGAFAYHGPALAGRAVCLIDDLYTTGATLDSCAAVLLEAGAETVWAYTLARPRPGAAPAKVEHKDR